nr:immunoglobulin heavy chain junction region [Mus musculus]
CARDGYYFDYW